MRFVIYVDSRWNTLTSMKAHVEASNWLEEGDKVLYLERLNEPTELVVMPTIQEILDELEIKP